MRGMAKAARAVVGGLAAGIALALTLCLATSALAVVTGTTVGVPGFFVAQAASDSDSWGVVFTPDWGSVALVAFVAVIGALMAGRRSATD